MYFSRKLILLAILFLTANIAIAEDYYEIDINSKVVKEEASALNYNNYDSFDNSLIKIYLKNQLGENVKVKLDEKRKYYLKPYEILYLGELEKKSYKVYVYDATGRLLGVIPKIIDRQSL